MYSDTLFHRSRENVYSILGIRGSAPFCLEDYIPGPTSIVGVGVVTAARDWSDRNASIAGFTTHCAMGAVVHQAGKSTPVGGDWSCGRRRRVCHNSRYRSFDSAPGQWQIDCMAEPTSKAASAAEATAAIGQCLAHVREIFASFTPATSTRLGFYSEPFARQSGLARIARQIEAAVRISDPMAGRGRSRRGSRSLTCRLPNCASNAAPSFAR